MLEDNSVCFKLDCCICTYPALVLKINSNVLQHQDPPAACARYRSLYEYFCWILNPESRINLKAIYVKHITHYISVECQSIYKEMLADNLNFITYIHNSGETFDRHWVLLIGRDYIILPVNNC